MEKLVTSLTRKPIRPSILRRALPQVDHLKSHAAPPALPESLRYDGFLNGRARFGTGGGRWSFSTPVYFLISHGTQGFEALQKLTYPCPHNTIL